MTHRFSNGVMASLALHLAAVVLIIGLTVIRGMRTDKPLDIFELVAGAGDNYMATEAPALGTAEGTAPQPAPAAEQPAAVVISPAPTAPAPKEVDFSKTVQKSVQKATAKIAAQTKKEEAAAEKAAQAEAVKQAAQAKMTLEEFNKQNKGKTTPAPAPKTNAPKIDAKGIAGGVVGGSTANTKGGAGGTAMKAAAGALVERYTSMLKERLQTNLKDQSPPGLSDTLVATASMQMLASGSLANGRITKSSGNTEFDKAVLDAIRLTKMPERPAGFETGTFAMDFRAKPPGD